LPPKNAIGWARAHVACYHNFMRAIAEGAAPEPSVAHGAYVQSIMEACALSDKRRAWVAVS
jgi:predicted dehydrogenase